MLVRARSCHSFFWSISTSFEKSKTGYSWPEHVTVHSGQRPQYLRRYITTAAVASAAAADDDAAALTAAAAAAVAAATAAAICWLHFVYQTTIK